MARKIDLNLLDEFKRAYANYVIEKSDLERKSRIKLSKLKGSNPGKYDEFKIVIKALLDEIKLIRSNWLDLESSILKLKRAKQTYYSAILNQLDLIERVLKEDWAKLESSL